MHTITTQQEVQLHSTRTRRTPRGATADEALVDALIEGRVTVADAVESLAAFDAEWSVALLRRAFLMVGDARVARELGRAMAAGAFTAGARVRSESLTLLQRLVVSALASHRALTEADLAFVTAYGLTPRREALASMAFCAAA